MSEKALKAVWKMNLAHAEKVVLAAMAWNADDNGARVFPSTATIAQRVGYSERQVRRVIDRLQQRQLLEPIGNRGVRGAGNRVVGYVREYRINLPAESDTITSDSTQPESDTAMSDSQLSSRTFEPVSRTFEPVSRTALCPKISSEISKESSSGSPALAEGAPSAPPEIFGLNDVLRAYRGGAQGDPCT